MRDQSVIRHPLSHLIDTVRGIPSSDHPGKEAQMSTLAPPMIVPTSSPPKGMESIPAGGYLAPMTSVASVITAMAARRPGLSDTKTQLLLFFCQGHHLAHFDNPLFTEPIYATDHGVTVEDVHGGELPPIDGNRPLTTISRALARYGNLSPADLRTLVQASQPWQLAMKSTSSPRIEWAWLRDWFRRPDETDDPDDERATRAEVAEAAAFLRSRRAS